MKKRYKVVIFLFSCYLLSCTQAWASMPTKLWIPANHPQGNEGVLGHMIEAFAPEVRLHPSDPYRPASVDWYQERCDLIEGENEIPYYLPRTLDGPDSVLYGQAPDKDGKIEAKCYVNAVVHVDEAGILQGAVLTYYFFYPYNGTTVPPFWGDHPGDWEHVSVIVRRYAQEEAPQQEAYYQVASLFYAAHGHKKYGKTLETRNIPVNASGHPLVYSSWHGHASHPEAMRFNLQLDFTKDGGPIWETWNHIVLTGTQEDPSPECPWIGQKIRWGGPEAPLTPSYQKTWRQSYHQTYPIKVITLFLDPLENGFNSEPFDLEGCIPIRIPLVHFKLGYNTPDHLQGVSFEVLHPPLLPFFDPKPISAPSKPNTPFGIYIYKSLLEGDEHRLVLKRTPISSPPDPEYVQSIKVVVEGIEPI